MSRTTLQDNGLICGASDRNTAGLKNLNKKDEFDFDHTKVLCDIAGCESTVSSKSHNLCDTHMSSTKKCCLSGCQNTTDENDLGMCLLCYQKNKDNFNDFIFLSQIRDESFNKKNVSYESFISTANCLPPLPSIDSFPMQKFDEQNQKTSGIFIDRRHHSNDNNNGDMHQARSNTGDMHQARNGNVNKTSYEDFSSAIEFIPPLPSAGPNQIFDEYQEMSRVYATEDKKIYNTNNNARILESPLQNQTLNQSFRCSQSPLKTPLDFTKNLCKKCSYRVASSNGVCLNCIENCKQYSTCMECGKKELVSNLFENCLCIKCLSSIQEYTAKSEMKSKNRDIEYCMQKPFFQERKNKYNPDYLERNFQDYNYQEFNFQDLNLQDHKDQDRTGKKNMQKDAIPCSTLGCPLFTILLSGKCHKCESQPNKFDLMCLKKGCPFYGSPEYNGLCSGCFMAMTIGESNQRQTNQSKWI